MHLHPHAWTLVAACAVVACAPAWADAAGDVRALVAAGKLDAALAAAEKAEQADPRDARVRFLKGVALMDLHRDEQALDTFRRLTEDYPELPDPYNDIAVIDARAGRLEEAQLALQTALRDDPSHHAARINLGQVHLMLAVKSWEAAAALGPLDAKLQHRLDVTRELLSDSAAGSGAGRDALAASPPDR